MDMTNVFPVTFYGYDSIIYIVSAIIGFLISYNAYKAFKLTNKRTHLFLFLSFLLLSIGFLTISLTSCYTYFRYFSSNEVLVFNGLFDISDLGYWIYFISSIISYILLVFMYLPKSIKDKFLLILPLSLSLNYYTYFNVVLFFLMGLVALRGIMNFLTNRNNNTFLVMASFSLLTIYHGVLMFSSFSKIFYVIAHLCLVGGFVSLLAMLVMVNKKWELEG